MTITFQWSEEYCVGDADIDNQHRVLMELANSLDDDMGMDEVKGILLQLVHHSKEHFVCEEKMMEQMKYPEIDEHKQLHTNMITTLSDFCLQKYETADEIHEFRKFVYDWVIDHLLHHDKKFFKYVRENRPLKNDGFELSL